MDYEKFHKKYRKKQTSWIAFQVLKYNNSYYSPIDSPSTWLFLLSSFSGQTTFAQ